MNCYLIALGSNLGERATNLQMGVSRLERFGSFLEFSKIVNTKALVTPDHPHQKAPDYLNQVALFCTNLDPDSLYSEIVVIEDSVGHPRTGKWPDRHLDLDLVFLWKKDAVGLGIQNLDRDETPAEVPRSREVFTAWTLQEWQSAKVTLPHPRFSERSFLKDLFQEIFRKASEGGK